MIFGAFILALEVAWRYQWIDTYRRELKALNPDIDRQNSKKTILVMGDSFTAAQNSWVNELRKLNPSYNIINSAVPGTNIIQANAMLSRRLKTFKPKLLIYQVYAGNDLFDSRYPLNWSELSLGRYSYWAIANHLRSISWLNYALGQFKMAGNIEQYADNKVLETEFESAKYNGREKIYLQAEPYLISDQVMLEGERKSDMPQYLKVFEEFISRAEKQCPVIVLVIPHAAQTSKQRMEQLEQVGAKFRNRESMQNLNYAFFENLAKLQSPKVKILNLLPQLQTAEAAEKSVYYLHDPHLNDEGQRLVAEVLGSVIVGDF